MNAIALVVDESAAPSAVLSTYQTLVRKPDRVILVQVRSAAGTAVSGDRHPEGKRVTYAQNMLLTRQALEKTGSVRVTTVVVREDVLPRELLKITEDERADMIIVGLGTTGGSRRLTTRRAVHAVERQAPVPVIVVQQRVRESSNTHDWNGRELYAA